MEFFFCQIVRLKAKIRKMEDENQDLTTRLNETLKSDNATVNIQEVRKFRIFLFQ